MKKRITKRKKIIIAALIALLVFVSGYFVYKKFIVKPKTYPQVPISQSNTTATKTDTTTPVATANPNVPGGTSGSDVTTTAELIAPSGNFISSHTLPMTAQAESICVTTIGATCQISFTNGGTTKSLPSQQAEASRSDQNGTVTWPVWTPESLGLTPGTWTITAKATLGSQTKSTVDPVKLTVKQ